MGRRLAERIPGATFISFSDCGHLCPLSNVDETLAAYRRFLASLPVASRQ
jgi:pimeloyl-ACP methyl ester carboxylesterase